MSTPREKPILMSAPMVRALLDGSKTMTRRIVKPDDVHYETDGVPGFQDKHGDHHDTLSLYRYGRPGDRLWVRESFSYDRLDVDRDGSIAPWYWADDNPGFGDWSKPKPSIHMPRWASRITLEITTVRLERLRDISQADCIAEGMPQKTNGFIHHVIADFRKLWSKINGPESWDTNPWVWVIEFKRIQP